MAVGLLLPALCSSDHRVSTAAASWVAANAAQSAIASSALMEAVDTALVNSAIRPCTCCYCKGHQGDRASLNAKWPPSVCSTISPGRPDHCLASSREIVSRVSEPAERRASGVTGSDDPRQCIAGLSGMHVLKPLAAKDLLLAESPVIKSPSSLGSVLHTSGPRGGEDDRSNTFASVGSGGGSATAPAHMRGNECSTGRCHRGRCLFEDVDSILEVSDNYCVGSENCEKHAAPWISLFSLVKVLLHFISSASLLQLLNYRISMPWLFYLKPSRDGGLIFVDFLRRLLRLYRVS